MGVRTNPDNKSFEELFGSTKADAFNHAYVLSKPPEMRPLFAGLSYAENDAARNPSLRMSDQERLELCRQLANKGIPIDGYIDWLQMDTPYEATEDRMHLGYTWVPNALQSNIVAGPKILFFGYSAYDPDNPPEGSILVPPDLSPDLTPVQKPNEFVGKQWDADRKLYLCTDRGMQAPEGQIVQEPDGGVYKRIGQLRTADPISQYIRLA
jgi:hypothetical protein